MQIGRGASLFEKEEKRREDKEEGKKGSEGVCAVRRLSGVMEPAPDGKGDFWPSRRSDRRSQLSRRYKLKKRRRICRPRAGQISGLSFWGFLIHYSVRYLCLDRRALRHGGQVTHLQLSTVPPAQRLFSVHVCPVRASVSPDNLADSAMDGGRNARYSRAARRWN